MVEAKREYRSATDGLQQALRYAQQLDAPLAYSSNGVEIIEHNLRTGQERLVSAPAVAWDEYQELHGLVDTGSSLLQQPLNRGRRDAAGDVITPRYYQAVAINRVLAAIARLRQSLVDTVYDTHGAFALSGESKGSRATGLH